MNEKLESSDSVKQSEKTLLDEIVSGEEEL